jgi:putative endopeptidase
MPVTESALSIGRDRITPPNPVPSLCGYAATNPNNGASRLMNQSRLSLLALFLILPVCDIHAQSDAPAAPLAHGISLANMDTAVRPGDDFYTYANGGFIARTKLPADRAALGVFNTLSDLSFKQTASIIEDAAKSNAAAGSNEREIADLYRSYMDEAAIESHGLSALKPHLAEIADINTPRELAHALGLSVRADVDALNNTNFHTANIFGLWVAPSFNDPDHYAP